MSRLATALDQIADRIERAERLDPVADALAGLARRVLPNGPFRDAASGTQIGHPVHPALVAVPIGSWVAASYLDATAGPDGAAAATRLVGLGNLSALPAATAGLSDWLDTTGAERRIGLVHALVNYVAFGLYGASWLARRRGQRTVGIALSAAGAGTLGVAGWLGGHLAYALGVGVDTTVFQPSPAEWTDVAADADVVAGGAHLADLGGVPVLLTRLDGGRLVALADRCTHRGGPLHEGELADGCVTCPWHGSRFRLADGTVTRGPATRPQPLYEVRVAAGRVELRRADEPRSMRTNPVGVS